MKAKRFFILACLSFLLMGGCSQNKEVSRVDAADTKPIVYTVNYPLYSFCKRIAGDLIDLHFPVPGDVDPAFWQPGADVVMNYQNADLIVLNGADYAKWISKVSIPESKVLNTSLSFQDKLIEETEHVTHSHGPEGAHSHAGVAFTTWLDFSLAKQQTESVLSGLTYLLPGKVEQLNSNYHSLKMDLMMLDQMFHAIAQNNADVPLFASHPVYQYLSNAYGFNIKSVLWEPDVYPSGKDWKELEAMLKKHPAKYMIWEGEPSEESVTKLQQLGVESIVVKPCGNRPDDGDFVSVMKNNALQLQKAFTE